MTPLTSSDPVFRFSDVGTPLQGKYKKPHRIVPQPTALPPWRDLSEIEARACLAEGQSLAVFGAPGTGKSYWVRENVSELRKAGKHVDIIAKTHASVQNFGEGAVTADHWVRQRIRSGGSIPCDLLVIEEITQIEVQIWSDICKFALAEGVALILCGDFSQFPAVCQHYAGCPVADDALERSDMVKDLSGSNRLTLKENRRSDQELFDFYANLTDRPLDELLLEARTRFPRTTRVVTTTIVISHAKRRFINCQCNLREKPADAVFLKAPHTDSKSGPQSMWVWAGLRVIGAGGPVKKGRL